VFVLDRDYVLVPGPKKADGGQRRLFGILQQFGSPAELAAKHRFISFEEIASAELVKKLPPRVHLTLHSGEKLPLYRRSDQRDPRQGQRRGVLPGAGAILPGVA
jgi:hypothetical protein